ncbi:hypothetical protein BIY22_16005 [Vibrio panuliri]|uniref:Uncharacterized protein n=2 Tax=Vibrio panuliri TaxID=1381081 RepID=A0A1Q9HNC1_9VIBR|nr:hypothetical protein BIY22_16005 [Vibrio panuliri]
MLNSSPSLGSSMKKTFLALSVMTLWSTCQVKADEAIKVTDIQHYLNGNAVSIYTLSQGDIQLLNTSSNDDVKPLNSKTRHLFYDGVFSQSPSLEIEQNRDSTLSDYHDTKCSSQYE